MNTLVSSTLTHTPPVSYTHLAKGEKCDIDAIEKDIIERDHRDMTRETSPLKQAADAVLLDSSDMTIDEVVDRMKQLVKEA